MPPLPRDKNRGEGTRDNLFWESGYSILQGLFRLCNVYTVRYYRCRRFLLTLPDLRLISFANKKEDYLHLNNVTRNDTN